MLVDVTPIMTSNSAPSPYSVIFSTENGGGPGTDAFKAFDRLGTEWVAGANSGHVGIDWGARLHAINGYSIQVQTPNRGPADWVIEASNDGSVWVTVDTRSGVSGWVSNTPVFYQFTTQNRVRFKMYRINITAINGGSNAEIEEMHFFAFRNGGGGGFIN